MSSGHPHIAQRKQRYQLRRILCQPIVANLGEAELALDRPERVLNLRANAGFELLGFVHKLPQGKFLFNARRLPGRMATCQLTPVASGRLTEPW